MFAALLQEGVVDELFLSLAPKLAGGGDAPAITSGPELPEPASLRLAVVLERDGIAVPALPVTKLMVCRGRGCHNGS